MSEADSHSQPATACWPPLLLLLGGCALGCGSSCNHLGCGLRSGMRCGWCAAGRGWCRDAVEWCVFGNAGEVLRLRVMASGQLELEFISSGISLLFLEPSALEQLEILQRGVLMQ